MKPPKVYRSLRTDKCGYQPLATVKCFKGLKSAIVWKMRYNRQWSNVIYNRSGTLPCVSGSAYIGWRRLELMTVQVKWCDDAEVLDALTRGKFNNASPLGRSLYWCQALHIMNKDRYQSTSARRALALLNSPQDSGSKVKVDLSVSVINFHGFLQTFQVHYEVLFK